MMINSMIDWLVNLIDVMGYPGVGLASFLESFFAPIPSEIILPFSGFVASQGSLDLWWVIVVASVAAYLGNLPFYLIGRWGEEFVTKFLKKYGKYFFISQKDIDMGYKAFDRYGYSFVFFGRLLPMIRTVISFPAGVAKMNFIIFSIFTLFGGFIWCTALIYAGYLLAENWLIVSEYLDKYEHIILIALIVGFALYIARGVYNLIKEGKERSENLN